MHHWLFWVDKLQHFEVTVTSSICDVTVTIKTPNFFSLQTWYENSEARNRIFAYFWRFLGNELTYVIEKISIYKDSHSRNRRNAGAWISFRFHIPSISHASPINKIHDMYFHSLFTSKQFLCLNAWRESSK